MSSKGNEIHPILKWAGGKRQLLPVLLPMMPKSFNCYFEPFFGGGALFCAVRPEKAVINDSNEDLINLYRCVKDNLESVCKQALYFQETYNSLATEEEKKNYYYELRTIYNAGRHAQTTEMTPSHVSAALLLFLNKAGFNGLYRENSSGAFNVPFAKRKSLRLFEESNLLQWSRELSKAKILCGDFETASKEAEKGDFVFFDSPYYDTFDTYQAGGFSEDDHKRLFRLFKELGDRGVYCMLTNSDTDFIRQLYRDYNIVPVGVKRMINRNKDGRTGKELIMTNYEAEKAGLEAK